MKIHFMAAVDGSQKDYQRIVDKFLDAGHELVTNHYLKRTIGDIKHESSKDSAKYVKNIKSWMRRADLIIFETSKPDTSVGYELATALSFMKPVMVFYREEGGSFPFSLKGVNSDKLLIFAYNDQNLDDALNAAAEFSSKAVDVRFNFFISPSIGQYLDWMAKEKRIPRSVYLRNLIEDDMENNEEYHS